MTKFFPTKWAKEIEIRFHSSSNEEPSSWEISNNCFSSAKWWRWKIKLYFNDQKYIKMIMKNVDQIKFSHFLQAVMKCKSYQFISELSSSNLTTKLFRNFIWYHKYCLLFVKNHPSGINNKIFIIIIWY